MSVPLSGERRRSAQYLVPDALRELLSSWNWYAMRRWPSVDAERLDEIETKVRALLPSDRDVLEAMAAYDEALRGVCRERNIETEWLWDCRRKCKGRDRVGAPGVRRYRKVGTA